MHFLWRSVAVSSFYLCGIMLPMRRHSTCAASFYLCGISCRSRGVLQRKQAHRTVLSPSFYPLAFETFGPINNDGLAFYVRVVRLSHLCCRRRPAWNLRRLSAAVRRFSAVCFSAVCFANSFGHVYDELRKSSAAHTELNFYFFINFSRVWEWITEGNFKKKLIIWVAFDISLERAVKQGCLQPDNTLFSLHWNWLTISLA
jgi:hypothetical protein